MKNLIRLAPVALLTVFLAGCQGPCQSISKIAGPAFTTGSASFSTYVAVGTSISAGWQSSGLVNRHQIHAFPALFAQQVGKTVLASGTGSFTFPAIDGNGIPPLVRIERYSPFLVVGNDGLTRGNPINLTQPTPYHNLGVPGALAYDFGNASSYYSTGTSRDTIFQIIARGQGTLAAQMLALQPTFISFEYGANEVLKPATDGQGTWEMPYPPAVYAAILTQSMNAIHTAAPDARLALFNVPDVTSIPFFTTFPSFTIDTTLKTPVALLGPNGPLTLTDHITLAAAAYLVAGHGFPRGSRNYVNPTAPSLGDTLPNWVILDSGEKDQLTGAIAQMNAAIDSVALRPWIAKVDMHGLLSDIAVNGYQLGGTHYTSAYITGGLFSLDGVHPNDLAHALLANLMIDAVNQRFGATVPRVNLSQFATTTASAALPATADGALRPYGYVQTNLNGLFGRH